MSDGPHKSLNMRRGWKRFSKRADEKAFSPSEVCEAIPVALIQDWRAEIAQGLPRQIQAILSDNQTSMFGDQRIEKLDALKGENSGHPLANTLIDCAIQAANNGKSGEEAMTEATSAALMDRADRGKRQVEEHYRRESTLGRAQNVRERMNEGISLTDFTQLSRSFLGTGDRSLLKMPEKQTGIDVGAPMP
jgi:hypothetical protein